MVIPNCFELLRLFTIASLHENQFLVKPSTLNLNSSIEIEYIIPHPHSEVVRF